MNTFFCFAVVILMCFFSITSVFAQTPSEVDEIISVYVDPQGIVEANHTCSRQLRRGESIGNIARGLVNKVIAAQNRRDPLAIGMPGTSITGLVYCFDDIGRPEKSLAPVAGSIGALLALKIKAGPQVIITKLDVDHANKLLTFASERGEDVGQFQEIVEKHLPKPAPTVDLENILEVKAEELSNEKRNNRLRVKRKYENKTVRARGKVWSVQETSSGKVLVSFDGWKRFIDGALYDSEFLNCVISANDDASIDKAIDLNKGDTATVIGVFGVSIINKMELSDCRIEG